MKSRPLSPALPDTTAKAAARFGLWLNATGRNADRLEAGLRDAGVPVARGRTVPLEQLAGLLMAADAHLVTLRPQFSGIVLPSKIYACLATRRPIVFVGPQSSDVHLLCTRKRVRLLSTYKSRRPCGLRRRS